jgi:hypothetical protein
MCEVVILFRDKLKFLLYYANKNKEIVSEYNFINS